MNVIRSYAPIGALMVAFALVGCDGETEMMDGGPDLTDAGPTDAGDAADTGVEGDGGVDGGMDEDSGVGCGADEAAVRGVCVATCGADTSGWDAALDESLTVVATFCSDADRFGTAPGDPTEVFTLRSEPVTEGTRIELARFIAFGSDAPTVLGNIVVERPSSELFLGGYLEPNGDASRIALGYTALGATVPGEVFSVASMDGTQAAVGADGNFDVAWLSEDTLLVNGLGAEGAGSSGQGLYAVTFSDTGIRAVRVGIGLGDFSGGVIVGPDYVLAGGNFGGENRAYVVLKARVEGAVSMPREIDFSAMGVRVPVDGFPSTFDLVNGMIVVQDLSDTFDLVALQAYPVEGYMGTTGLSLGAPIRLTSGNLFDVAHEAGGGRMLLEFAGGLLLVE